MTKVAAPYGEHYVKWQTRILDTIMWSRSTERNGPSLQRGKWHSRATVRIVWFNAARLPPKVALKSKSCHKMRGTPTWTVSISKSCARFAAISNLFAPSDADSSSKFRAGASSNRPWHLNFYHCYFPVRSRWLRKRRKKHASITTTLCIAIQESMVSKMRGNLRCIAYSSLDLNVYGNKHHG